MMIFQDCIKNLVPYINFGFWNGMYSVVPSPSLQLLSIAVRTNISALFVLQATIPAVEEWEMSLGTNACLYHTYRVYLKFSLEFVGSRHSRHQCSYRLWPTRLHTNAVSGITSTKGNDCIRLALT